MNHYEWPVRVYYEDTDAGGVVYYANYLAYMERARTEWLRASGFENQRLMDEDGVVFAVRRASIEYLKPARLDDELTVHASVAQLKRASLLFKQEIRRGDELLCSGEILLVCVDTQSFRSTSIPDKIRDRIDRTR
ncbi:tol-pal system-associated acyl-CoA thioesterase [Solemya velum gill symbiont]|uniref:tol-pal system-associated acyl-CoA thioesterase n=1 Tax=Solemya velum gill symbiont TaxID=2340 RepID=UPI000998B247|nr:tol-pal system-associated acyl-CoA thioesterase [Solemya velum gill symbiont]OOZ44433.1 tol-pal system-associated acyl-CoA thioesterase [Solemya velum gill symbiont]OOZ46232.1 tol-pal system-associated acyl-CoA thioesterase [Solemya velum gill symbiont]OOZ48810.1 tol-pal system-associated acyl-CoA thioesterase [Solemya velum gill symbiont]OOZ51314.1 tol-pal system-associated acyl-CoA thioesterase [Solemya velum gill symbiont]OOZ53867.1 tol-pal system-associated acyl-CoA thioesterase [Solemy